MSSAGGGFKPLLGSRLLCRSLGRGLGGLDARPTGFARVEIGERVDFIVGELLREEAHFLQDVVVAASVAIVAKLCGEIRRVLSVQDGHLAVRAALAGHAVAGGAGRDRAGGITLAHEPCDVDALDGRATLLAHVKRFAVGAGEHLVERRDVGDLLVGEALGGSRHDRGLGAARASAVAVVEERLGGDLEGLARDVRPVGGGCNAVGTVAGAAELLAVHGESAHDVGLRERSHGLVEFGGREGCGRGEHREGGERAQNHQSCFHCSSPGSAETVGGDRVHPAVQVLGGKGLLGRLGLEVLVAGARVGAADLSVHDAEDVGDEEAVVLARQRVAGVGPDGLGDLAAG